MTNTQPKADTKRAVNQNDTCTTISIQRKCLFSALFVVVALGLAELVGRAILSTHSQGQRYLSQSYFQDKPWAEDLLSTFDQLEFRYEPYVGWRRADITSPYLNVIDGERQTVHPTQPTSDAIQVWCFGGSTMWGTASRDSQTIASHLARLAQEEGFDVHVRNLGESGWVSTQELIKLTLECRSGRSPDVAIFYDGVNDVFSALQNRRTDGVPQNMQVFKDYFERGVDPRRRWYAQSAIYNGFRLLAHKLAPADHLPETTTALDDRAHQTVTSYVQNAQFLRQLGRVYNFDTLFFWQPIISFQYNYKVTEREAFQRNRDSTTDEFIRLYESATKYIPRALVINLARPLEPGVAGGYFIDHNHLNEPGNLVIATSIYQRLRPLLVIVNNRSSAGPPS